ncbi:hypothetical protein LINGRAHAP2_LOCUS4465 [Linum grandiflorum]
MNTPSHGLIAFSSISILDHFVVTTKEENWRELFIQVLCSSSHSLPFQLDFKRVIDIWGRQVKKWKSFCDYGLEVWLVCYCSDVDFNGSHHCVLYQDYCKILRRAHQVFDESSMSELFIWKFSLPSQDYGLVLDVWGRGAKKQNYNAMGFDCNQNCCIILDCQRQKVEGEEDSGDTNGARRPLVQRNRNFGGEPNIKDNVDEEAQVLCTKELQGRIGFALGNSLRITVYLRMQFNIAKTGLLLILWQKLCWKRFKKNGCTSFHNLSKRMTKKPSKLKSMSIFSRP